MQPKKSNQSMNKANQGGIIDLLRDDPRQSSDGGVHMEISNHTPVVTQNIDPNVM